MTHMRLHKLTFGVALVAALALGAPGLASAQSRYDAPDYTARQSHSATQYTRRAAPDGRFQMAQNKVTPSQAKSIAMRAVPGSKYLDLRSDGNGYRVWLINDGHRIEVYVDARTGAYRIAGA